MTNVIKNKERMFLTAFKNAMRDIEKEMREMKQQMTEEKLKEKHEHKLKRMESERDWFRTEALK